jgi:hypothetical protein
LILQKIIKYLTVDIKAGGRSLSSNETSINFALDDLALADLS